MDAMDFGFDAGTGTYDTAEDIWGDMACISIFLPDHSEEFKIDNGICVLMPLLEYVRGNEIEIKRMICEKVKEKFKDDKKMLGYLRDEQRFINGLYANNLSVEFYDLSGDYDSVLVVKFDEDFIEMSISVCIDKELNVVSVRAYY